MNKLIDEKGISVAVAVIITAIVVGVVVGAGVYMTAGGDSNGGGGGGGDNYDVTASDVKNFLSESGESTLKDVLQSAPQDVLASVLQQPRDITLAIEHFSLVEGTTWDGAQNRAAKRLTEKYPSLNYVYREEVSPDQTNPFAEELISGSSADIIVGSAEFMGLPLEKIAPDYPDKYFSSIMASDLTTKKNFIRYFPAQYQALYLEGIIAGALTDTGNIGITSAFPCIQVLRREAAFRLGIQRAEEILDKEVTVYKKYVGSWFDQTAERSITETLITDQNCDVVTQQTDSGAPLDVAQEQGVWFIGKDMDIVGEYGWGTTETVAVSFDTRWEVGFEMMVKDYAAGNPDPQKILNPDMSDTITLANGETLPTVDLMNDNKTGIDAISPSADVPESIVTEVKKKRALMMKGAWDPFYAAKIVSNGTGLDSAPSEGTVVWESGEMPSTKALFRDFTFDVAGDLEILG